MLYNKSAVGYFTQVSEPWASCFTFRFHLFSDGDVANISLRPVAGFSQNLSVASFGCVCGVGGKVGGKAVLGFGTHWIKTGFPRQLKSPIDL